MLQRKFDSNRGNIVKKNYQLAFRHSAGNLHITVEGVFSDMCAWELVKLIRRKYYGFGRVFIKASDLTKIDDDGARLFKSIMNDNVVPLSNFYIKGKAGFKIAPDGSRVIIFKKPCSHRRLRLIKHKDPAVSAVR